MIITVANNKGGVGKSTLSVHLAAWLHAQGHSVTLADCDTQQSSSEWIREALPDVKTVRLSSPSEILNELPQLRQEVDFVVADGPGSNTETSLALLASRFRHRAMQGQHAGGEGARPGHASIAGGPGHPGGKPDAVIVLNMVGKNYRLTKDMMQAAAALELPWPKRR